MARVSAFAAGMLCGLLMGTAIIVTHAEDVSAEVLEAATAAHVDPLALQGAVNTTGLDPFVYLRGVGELAYTSASSSATAIPASNARVACLESKESQGLNIANRRGSGAVGVLQFMPSTFAAHAAEMGHPEWSPWSPEQARAVAAHDLALGRRSQWSVGGC